MADAIIVFESGAKDKQTGMVRGMSTPMVPQDVPVVKEIKTPRRKTQKLERAGGRDPFKAWERKEAAPSSRRVPLKNHAAMRTREGVMKRPIPLMNSFLGDKPEIKIEFRFKNTQ